MFLSDIYSQYFLGEDHLSIASEEVTNQYDIRRILAEITGQNQAYQDGSFDCDCRQYLLSYYRESTQTTVFYHSDSLSFSSGFEIASSWLGLDVKLDTFDTHNYKLVL